MSDIDDIERTIKRAQANQWRNENLESTRARQAANYANNKEAESEKRKRAYAALSPEVKAERMAYQKQWAKDHPEESRAIKKRYRDRNKEKLARAERIYAATTAAKHRVRARTAATLETLAGRPRPDVCDICKRAARQGEAAAFRPLPSARIHFRGWIKAEDATT